MARYVPSENGLTWDTITERLGKFNPDVVLEDYIDFSAKDAVKVFKYSSEGVSFVVGKSKHAELVRVLKQARTGSGKQAFIHGRWQGALHALKGAAKDLANSVTGRSTEDSWAADISFKATKGDGFREIWYLELTDRQLRLRGARDPGVGTPEPDPKFGRLFDPGFSRLQPGNPSLDLSSLHFAVGDPDPKTGLSSCNVHIDQVGIVADSGTGAALTLDFGYHTLVELAFRTGLKGILPDRVLQAVDFILPSSHENYAFNFGTQITVINRRNLRLSVRGVCGHDGGPWGCSATINVGGRHNWLGGK